MRQKFPKVFGNFSGGWNGAVDATDLPDNAFQGKNWLPSRKRKGALEKVRVRQRDLLNTTGDGQDDRIASATLTSYGSYPFAFPDFDNVEEGLFYYNNLYSRSTIGQPASATALSLYHNTPANMRCKIGIYLHESVYPFSDDKGIVLAVRMRRLGTYSSVRHKLTATLYPAQTTNSKPAAVGSITAPTYTASSLGTTDYEWVTFEFLYSTTAGPYALPPGEYFVELTDSSSSGATVTQCYQIALSANASDPYGFAIATTAAGTVTTQPLAECFVYRKYGDTATASSQDAYTVQPTAIYRGRRTADGATLVGTINDQGTLSAKDRLALLATDGNTIFAITDINDIEDFAQVNYFNGYMYNSVRSLTTKPKFIGSINNIAFYRQQYIIGGRGGIAIVDDSNLYVNSYTFSMVPDAAIPNIENRINTVDYEWVTTYTKDADVYQPEIKDLFVAGINPGRIFALTGDSVIWSGGTSASTTGDPTQVWSPFAVIDFGDSQETIVKGCWYRGYILLFCESGALYYITGEPPVNPANGYGTLRADYIGTFPKCSHTCVTPYGVFFGADEGRQLWFMDAGFTPRRIEDEVIASLKIAQIDYEQATDRLWVSSEKHVKRSYLTTTTNDATLTYEYETACSYMLELADQKWYYIQRPLDIDETANQPTTFIERGNAWKLGVYDNGSGTRTSYGKVQSVDVDEFNPNASSEANLADPENSDYRSVSSTSDLYVREIDYTEATGLMAAEGQIWDVMIKGTLYTGSTLTVYAVDEDGAETSIGSISGDQTWASPTTKTYRLIAGSLNRSPSGRIKVSISGEYRDEIRSVGFTALVNGQKASS
jgi:hypothetical protein